MPSSRPALRGLLAAALLLGGGAGGLALWSRAPVEGPPATVETAAHAPAPVKPQTPAPEGTEAESGANFALRAPEEGPAAESLAVAPSEAVAEAALAPAPAEAPPAPVDPTTATPPLTARWVPLPVPRPPEFRAGRLTARAPRALPARTTSAAPPPEDTRSFIEKLFGVESPEPPRLAYAALETKPVDNVFRQALSALPPSGAGGVAVYDIRAKVVTLPNGEKLEAHSGLGEAMDNPGHVHVRMKGPTPLGTYDIREREQPFHGVRALRLTPVGGPEAVHGRVGLLAHTYMLGPSGASNGCVSFRDYEKFLQAYLRGEVQRLVVVAGG
jgi:hypothetical protein